MCVFVFVFMHVQAIMPWCTHGGQRKLVGLWWMEIEHRSLGLLARAFFPEPTVGSKSLTFCKIVELPSG